MSSLLVSSEKAIAVYLAVQGVGKVGFCCGELGTGADAKTAPAYGYQCRIVLPSVAKLLNRTRARAMMGVSIGNRLSTSGRQL